MSDDLAVADLRQLLSLGLTRGGALLTAGEQLVLRRMLALDGDAARLYARLSARRPRPWAVDRLELPDGRPAVDAVDELVECGLLTRFVPWPRRLEALTVEELKDACRAHRLRVSGKRAVLEERVAGRRVGRERDVVSLRHVALLRRVMRFALGRLEPDRSQGVRERIGVVRWPEYARTRGAAVLPTRRDLLAWEAVLEGPLTAVQALDVLEDPGRVWPPGRLDPRRRLTRAVLELARDTERQGALAEAEALYRRLEPLLAPGRLAVRLARVVELQDRPSEALAVLDAGRRHARLADRVAIDRAGRRLARSLRGSWAPSRPLHAASERSLGLVSTPGEGARPLWEGRTVEAAVIQRLEAAGRRALHGEGAVWRALFALLFAEVYFLPVHGQLPVPFLSGPLDLGTPAFRSRRRDAVDAVLDAVAAGEAGARVAAASERWWGTRLRGGHWEVGSPEQLVALAKGIEPSALVAVLDVLLDRGLGAAAGLPDLVVLPGPAVRLADLHPSKLADGVTLVEVKGPGDTLRDEQRVWHHRLADAGAAVEVWKIQKAARAPHVQ
ncbi:MAG: hypothetical protein EP330_03905 [Deltaproteobacteria bacterium]|nr:MAG: hypothetical protein EP330_03905 [Deltaproteobacteria bacterium]